jgi:hypothetical protein
MKFGVSYEQFGVSSPNFANNNGNYSFSGWRQLQLGRRD